MGVVDLLNGETKNKLKANQYFSRFTLCKVEYQLRQDEPREFLFLYGKISSTSILFS